MASPYEYGPVEFDAPGGGPTVVELKLPHRGTIAAIRLFQIGGANVGGSFRIFTLREAALDIAGSSASAALTGMDPDFYSVFGRKEFTAGGYEEYGIAHHYRNRDGNYSVPIRRLWLVIEPGGTGDKLFALSITIDQGDIGG